MRDTLSGTAGPDDTPSRDAAPGTPDGVDTEALRRALRSGVAGRVAFDPGTRALYTADASNYRSVPLGVVLPRTADDVIAAVAVCAEYGVPLTPRGGGTSIAGNAIGPGVVIDASRHLTAIEEVDPDARTARVQPGVVLDRLREAAAPHGLTFGPDPSTHSRCTLGGMIGNNACGSHSVAWGTTADNVESLDVLLADGTRMRVGATSEEEFDRRAALPDREGRVYAGLRDLAAAYADPLRTGMPRLARRVSGYALDRLLPENGGNIARALTGTEGGCVTVLGATVNLVPAPPAKALAVLGYPDAPAAADAVPEILVHGPLTVEGLNERLVAGLDRPGARSGVALPDGRAWLLVELAGEDAGAAAAAGHALVAALKGGARPAGSAVVTDPAQARALWRIREEGAGLTSRTASGAEAWSGWEDAAVPPERLGSYLREFDRLMERHGRDGVVYGHFGEGCLHVRIDFELDTDPGVRNYRAFMEDAADLVVAHGGSISGEHGDGRARSELLPRMYGPELMEAFGAFKRVWDPGGLMNPGAVVAPRPLDADLRVPASGRAPLTVLSYAEDGGDFAKALRRCSGVGKCRRHEGPGVMCPSYQVTREEKHSTRGRARLLFEMLNGEVVTDGWRSEEVRDSLDLCLSCKGCLSDCPVDVDMASYKAEFLHHHYKGRLRPASHYSMGWLPVWARLASLAPAEADRAVRTPGLSALLKRAGGIARERDLPSFPRTTFTRWFRRRPPAPGHRGAVVLWPDTFGTYLEPRVPASAVRVLESAGFRVVLPKGPVCCGLTWVSTGQLGTARRVMRRSVRALEPFTRAGVPVVGLEPSCTAALRTDLKELLPGEGAERTAASVHTLAGFLSEAAPDWEPPRVAGDALAQVHCHQHAVIGYDAERALMDRAGIRTRVLDSGCCGLAGNFGFEEGHYAVSKAVGEQSLLPEVRGADPDTMVVADGFSCRTQVVQETGRTAVHLAEALASGLPKG
ncbi:FAD-binding and (Fe-S)-binding domain-containing protein [Nocardiopsis suaedae]|uniref:FAD-binding and (Fe-S)-binding domain-containing protein n=1 Tax=Nocardiopsis suaedae TaxID=3018444 RepID=A0ABT4TEF4_9ACTN|nr:FAD-binding and (Fe-S)-binding domain-containing protein [Nocardiopsis suaedae]MDA2803025.1 FAD-binding and (Fe-S)-binding domain-containing protein [Nocardiopsis suaedae]